MKNYNTKNTKSLNESSVRSKAVALGFKLQKSPGRNKESRNYGTYQLASFCGSIFIMGSNYNSYGLSLQECAEFVDKMASHKGVTLA